MKIFMKAVFFVFLCGLGAVAHASDRNITVNKVYNGGFTQPDVFVIEDSSRGATCYLFDGGNNVTSACMPTKDLKKPVDSQ